MRNSSNSVLSLAGLIILGLSALAIMYAASRLEASKDPVRFKLGGVVLGEWER